MLVAFFSRGYWAVKSVICISLFIFYAILKLLSKVKRGKNNKEIKVEKEGDNEEI